MAIKISQKTLEFLRDIIVGGGERSPYKTKRELVRFFNNLGFNDNYENEDCNLLSRRRSDYTEDRLKELNEDGRINEVLEAYFSPINFIESEYDLNFLINEFNKYLEYDGYNLILENKKIRIVTIDNELIKTEELYNLNNEVIRENIEKCDKKIEEGDFAGAITNARTFLESLLLYIYKEIEKKDYDFDGDLPKLYKEIVNNTMNIRINEKDDVKKILGGLSSIIFGVSSISNKMADRHGRLNNYDDETQEIFSILAVNAVKTLALFLYHYFMKEVK